MSEVRLGELAPADAMRDAVHIAIIPMTAVREMQPGERLKNGIVDPYLTAPVKPGERFFLCLFPGTVTSLRHVWTHPSYGDELVAEEPKPRRSEADVWADMFDGDAILHRSFDRLPLPTQAEDVS